MASAGDNIKTGIQAARGNPISIGKLIVRFGVPIFVALLLFLFAFVSTIQASLPVMADDVSCSGVPSTAGATTTAQVSDLNQDERNRAATVISEGYRLKVPTQGIIIALGVAWLESLGFHNYANNGTGRPLNPAINYTQAAADYVKQSMYPPYPKADAVGNDTDSLGIFQQRPSAGWGGPQQPGNDPIMNLMTPSYAADKFYAALLAVPGWQSMQYTVAANTVQRSANPGAYAAYEGKATALYNALKDNIQTVSQTGGTGNAQPLSATLTSSCGDTTDNSADGAATPADQAKVAAAIARAKSFFGAKKTDGTGRYLYAGMCDAMVAGAYGYSYSGEDTAYKHWLDIPVSLRHTDRNPPPGALIFFEYPANTSGAGHVAFSLGNGQQISDSGNNGNTITMSIFLNGKDYQTVDDNSNHQQLITYLGWAPGWNPGAWPRLPKSMTA